MEIGPSRVIHSAVQPPTLNLHKKLTQSEKKKKKKRIDLNRFGLAPKVTSTRLYPHLPMTNPTYAEMLQATRIVYSASHIVYSMALVSDGTTYYVGHVAASRELMLPGQVTQWGALTRRLESKRGNPQKNSKTIPSSNLQAK